MNKEQAFLLIVLLATALLSLLVVLPFLQFVLLAVILAYVLHPVNLRLKPVLGHQVAPMATLTGAALLALLPSTYVLLSLYRDLQRFAAGETALQLGAIERWLQGLLGDDVDLSTLLEDLGRNLLQVLFGDIAQLVSVGVFWTIGFALVLFLVYYVLRDGAAFVDWAIRVAPIRSPVCYRLIEQIDQTTRGVIVGHLFVAIAQGVIGGFGLWITGIPNVIFWGFVMILLSLLPVIGAFFVWAPAAGYLHIIGEPGSALFLVLWGLLVVSVVDNYARPIVIDREAHLNPGIILIGVFGGIYALGFTGLFVGPIVLGVFAAALTVFDEEWDRLGEGPGPA